MTKKTTGRVYTPNHIVKLVLNAAEYRGETILDRHVIDNSAGDGAFLTEIVHRYCNAHLTAGRPLDTLPTALETYIHGIEIDAGEAERCKHNLDTVAHTYGIEGVTWDVEAADAFTVTRHDGRMDFVVGNPPYVRIHNLGKHYAAVRGSRFTTQGMTDLYIAFYDIGLRMLNDTGVLSYITPSSLNHSKAAQPLREHLIHHDQLTRVIDLHHEQPFEATTYTAIYVLRHPNAPKPHDGIQFAYYDPTNPEPYWYPLDADLINRNGYHYYAPPHALQTFHEIVTHQSPTPATRVKNGFATLADKIFIGDFDFDHTIPVVKASTGQWKRSIFPYRDGHPIAFEEMHDPNLRAYLLGARKALEARSLAPQTRWYEFGRSQAINDVPHTQYAVNSLIKTPSSVRVIEAGPGTGVYGGLYVRTDHSRAAIEDALTQDRFMHYIQTLGKYKSGGYYTFSSIDLQRYLNHYFDTRR